MLFSATFPGKLRAAAARWLGGDRTVFIRVGAVQLQDSGAAGQGRDGARASRPNRHSPGAVITISVFT